MKTATVARTVLNVLKDMLDPCMACISIVRGDVLQPGNLLVIDEGKLENCMQTVLSKGMLAIVNSWGLSLQAACGAIVVEDDTT